MPPQLGQENRVSRLLFGSGGGGGGRLERLFSKHRWLSACVVGTHWLRLTFVVYGLSAAARRVAKIILRLNSDEGGGSGGAGGAVSSMIQATSEAKYFWWWYWAGFLEPPFCWSKKLSPQP